MTAESPRASARLMPGENPLSLMLRACAFWMIMGLFHTPLDGQAVTFSKVIDFFPLNGEIGLEIYETEGGYILLIDNDCINFVSANPTCRTIIKIDFQGEISWMLELDMEFSWIGHFLESEDAYYLTGRDLNATSHMALAKVSKQGELVWQRELTGIPLTAGGQGIVNEANGNVKILANRRRPWLGEDRATWWPFVLTVTPEGEFVDLQFFNDDYFYTLPTRLIRSTEGRYLASYTYCPDACAGELRGGVISIDGSGTEYWRKELPFVWLPLMCAVDQLDEQAYAYQWYHRRTPPHPHWAEYPPAFYYMDADGAVFDSIVFHNQTLKDVLQTDVIWGSGLVGTGRQYFNLLNPSPVLESAWLFRIDENRQVAWERAYADTTAGGRTQGLYQIRHTSDGGYIGAGAITNWMSGVWETHVWVLKLDSLGCLAPGCGEFTIVSTTEPSGFPAQLSLRAFPNPASDRATIAIPEELAGKDMTVSVLSPMGQLVRRQPYQHPGTEIDVAGLPAGIYYVVLHQRGQLLGVAKLAITR